MADVQIEDGIIPSRPTRYPGSQSRRSAGGIPASAVAGNYTTRLEDRTGLSEGGGKTSRVLTKLMARQHRSFRSIGDQNDSVQACRDSVEKGCSAGRHTLLNRTNRAFMDPNSR